MILTQIIIASVFDFVKRLHKDSSGITSLRIRNGVMITSKSKLENLTQQCQTVFTKEGDNIPYIRVLSSNHSSINNLSFSVNQIQKLLQELKHGKASGKESPDNIPTWIPQTCSAEIASNSQ